MAWFSELFMQRFHPELNINSPKWDLLSEKPFAVSGNGLRRITKKLKDAD